MAATAGSVAVGSALGRGLTDMLFGKDQAPTEEPTYNKDSCDFQATGICPRTKIYSSSDSSYFP